MKNLFFIRKESRR